MADVERLLGREAGRAGAERPGDPDGDHGGPHDRGGRAAVRRRPGVHVARADLPRGRQEAAPPPAPAGAAEATRTAAGREPRDGAPRTTVPDERRRAAWTGSADPFAEVKNRIHLATRQRARPAALRRRATATPRATASRRRSGRSFSRRSASRARTASGSRRRSQTTSSATGRSSGSCRTRRSRRSWSTARTRSGSSGGGLLSLTDAALLGRVASAADHHEDGRPDRPAHRRVVAAWSTRACPTARA